MHFRSTLALTICGLCLLVMIISGCETLKGAARGGAEGFAKDWQSAQKIDEWIRENLW